MSIDVVGLLWPEIVVLAVATWTYVGSAFSRTNGLWGWFAAGGLCVAGMHLYQQGDLLAETGAAVAASHGVLGTAAVLEGPLAMDAFSYSMRWAALGMGLLFVMMTMRSAAAGSTGEIVGSLLMIVAGLMLTASANEMVLLFVGLELISIPTYILLYLGRRGGMGRGGIAVGGIAVGGVASGGVAGGGGGMASDEATTKYFFLSILSSAVLLYGFSFLYGIGGTTNLTGLHDRLALVQASSAAGRADTAAMAGLMPMARLAAVLVFAALAFKIAAVPFHFYAPDVYQGTTAANAGLLAVAPKIAGIVVLVRIFVASMPAEEIKTLGWQLALAAALLSMTLGNVLALWQNNPRRLLAYSSIAHAGYMLIGLAVGLAQSSAAATHGAAAGDAIGGLDGIGALLFYLAAYAAATIGTFAALAYLSRDGRDVDSIDELAGLGRSRPGVAAAVAAFMFSLAGIPPLAGFWGKFTLFAGALKVYFDTGGAASDIAADVSDPSMPTWFLALAIAAALNAAIGAAYYLRIVGVMYFRAPVAASQPQGGWGALAATWVCAAVVLGIGLHPGPAVEQGRRASQAARATLEPLSRPHRLSDRSMALDATVP